MCIPRSYHCMKNHIFFYQMFWKDGLPKNIALEYDHSVLSGKVIFLFPENMILSFSQKMKDDISQKWTWKCIFFKCSEKMVFQKQNHTGIWTFLYYLERWYVFLTKNMKFFLWTQNERWSFSRNIWKYNIFCIYI